MKSTPIAGGFSNGQTPRQRNQARLRRAAIEALEERKYLYDDFAITKTGGLFEGDYVTFDLDVYTDRPGQIYFGTPQGGGNYEEGIDYDWEDSIISPSGFHIQDDADLVTVGYWGNFWDWDPDFQNVAPNGWMSNSGPVNEGSPVTVTMNASDVSLTDNASLRYSFSTSAGGLAGDYASAGTSSSVPFTFNDNGTVTVYGRVFDKDGGYSDSETTITVANVAPYATLGITEHATNGSVTIALSGPNDPSSVDHAAGYKYAFSNDYNSLPSTGGSAGTATSRVFTAAEMEGLSQNALWARIFDKNNGYRDYNVSVPPLSVTAVSSSQINLTWADTATGESNWRIQVSEDGTNFTLLTDLGPNITSYSVQNLSDGTRRWYRVRAVGTAGTPSDTIYSPKKAATTYLAKASNVIAVADPNSGAGEISWKDNSVSETGYEVLESVDGINFITLGTVAANATGFDLAGLSSNLQYSYRIETLRDGLPDAESVVTPIVIVGVNDLQANATFHHNNVVGDPTRHKITIAFNQDIGTSLQDSDLLLENVDTGQIITPSQLNWAYNSSAKALTITFKPSVVNATYANSIIERALPDGNYQLLIKAGSINTTSGIPLIGDLSHEFHVLSGDADHNRVVDVRDMYLMSLGWFLPNQTFSQGDFNYDGQVNQTDLTILALKWQTTMPKPSAFNVVVMGPNLIQLSWDPSPDAPGWRVQQSDDGQNFTTLDDLEEGSLPFFIDNTALDGNRYWYRIYEIIGGVIQSTPYTIKKGGTTPLLPPSINTATVVSDSQITVSWLNQSARTEYFDVYRSTTGTADWALVGTVEDTVTSFSDSALSDGTKYYYYVQGRNSQATSAPSETRNATTSLRAPTGLIARPLSSTRIGLEWIDNSRGEIGYKIERRVSGGSWTPITTTALNEGSFTDTGRDSNTTYFYQVTAISGAGDSDPSNESSATTLFAAPPTPTSLQAVVGTSGITLSWGGSAIATTYIIERKAPKISTEVNFATLAETPSPFYLDADVDEGTQYIYRVRAVNGTGQSTSTAEYPATTSIPAPSAPSIVQAFPHLAVLTWEDNATDETFNSIEYSTNGGVNWQQADFAPNTESAPYPLSEGYWARVIAKGRDIWSSPSGHVVIPAPSGESSPEYGIQISFDLRLSGQSMIKATRTGSDLTSSLDITLNSPTGTLIEGVDYDVLNRTVFFPGTSAIGEQTVEIPINVRPDGHWEPGKTIGITVAPQPSLYTVIPYGSVGTVLGGLNLKIDSNNSISIDAEDEAVENLPYHPGHIMSVNSYDSLNTGNIGMIAGIDGRPASTKNLAPLFLGVDAPNLPADRLVFRFVYEQSDPATGQSNGSAYTPAPGYFRLWKATTGNRSSASVLSSGHFVPSSNGSEELIQYRGDDLSKLGITVTSTGAGGTFLVEAVRPHDTLEYDSEQPAEWRGAHEIRVEVAIAPDSSGTSLPDSAFSTSDTIKITAVNSTAPGGFKDGVRPDGAIRIENEDFSSSVQGAPGTGTRTFSNAPELLTDHTGWDLTGIPRVLHATNTYGSPFSQVAIGGERLYFDLTSGAVRSRYGTRYTFGPLGSTEYVLFNVETGDRWIFHGFEASRPVQQRGMLKEFIGAGDIHTTYQYDGNGNIAFVTREDSRTVYSYGNDEDGNAQLQSVVITNSRGLLQTTSYSYYAAADGAQPNDTSFKGNKGDLRSVRILNGSGVLTGYWHYRYYKKPNSLDQSRLRFVVDSQGAARAPVNLAAGEDLYSIANVASYSESYYEYDALGRISSRSIRGRGSSSAVTHSTNGTYNYAYASNSADAYGTNAWKYKFTVTAPGNTQFVTYANDAFQPLLESISHPGSGGLPSLSQKTVYEYDLLGRITKSATPSAVEPTINESSLQPGSIKSNSGLVYVTSYYPQTSGLLRNYVQDEYIQRGANESSRVQIGHFEFESRVFASLPRFLPKTIQRYRGNDGSGVLTTSYQYNSYVGFEPAHVTVTPMSTAAQNGQAITITDTFDRYGRLTSRVDGDGKQATYAYDDDTGILKKAILDVGGEAITTSTQSWDEFGRPTRLIDANNLITQISYVDSFKNSTVTTTTPTGIIRREQVDRGLGTVEQLVTAPDGTLQLISRDYLDLGGRVITSERYSDAPTYTSSYTYDAAGRQTLFTNPNGTTYQTLFDGLGRPIQDKIGGAAIRDYKYDDSLGGNGNLIELIEHPDGNPSHDRVTRNSYDWRDRLMAVDNGPQVFYCEYDNTDQPTIQTLYDGNLIGPVSTTNGVPDRPDAAARRAHTDTLRDDRGQVYRTLTYSVDPSNGNLGGTLVTNYHHDGRDNVVKIVAPGGLVTKHEFDGAGRQKLMSQGTEATVLESVQTEYDKNGNARRVTHTQRQPDGSNRVSRTVSLYNSENRVTALVDFGTDPAGAGSLPLAAPDRSRPQILVTTNTYDVAGNLDTTTDAKGVITDFDYDRLGRVTSRLQNVVTNSNSTDANVNTLYEYDGLDQIKLISMLNRTPQGIQNQITTYAFGGTGIVGNDELRQITYPGGTTEVFTRNNLGEVLTDTERNGVVHTYTYDPLGRIMSDSVSIPAGAADDLVTKRVFAYDAIGNLTLASTENAGGPVNQVKREYNGFAQLIKELQEHTGAVDANTPFTQYHYTFNAGANYNRLTSVTYPHPTDYVVGYEYSGIDDQISRASGVTANSTPVETYEYLGVDRVLNRIRPETGIADLTQTLNGLGRVETTIWKEGANLTDQFSYAYDRTGNLTSRVTMGQNLLPESFHYNRMGILETFSKGFTQKSWALDSQGNRYPDARTYTPDNRISFTGFTSDAAGNSTQIRTIADEKFKTKFDAWGNVVSAEVRDASDALLRGSTYYHDALGRRVQTFGYVITVGQQPFEIRDLYYDAGGHVVQEDKMTGVNGTKLATQLRYVWSPDGQMILRDFNTDNNDANGLEQRIYVQQNAQGNVTALIDGSNGNVLERYTYGPLGMVEVRNADWINYTPSEAWTPTERYNWVYLYEGMRLDPLAVVYHAGPGKGDYDPIEGRMMQPELSAFGNAQNAYDPGPVTSDGWGWGLAQTGIGTTTGILALATPAAPFVIAAGLGLLAYQAYQGYSEYGGVGGALANVSGVAPIYEGWTDTHWRTGAELGLSDSQRTAMFSGGIFQLGGWAYGTYRAAPSIVAGGRAAGRLAMQAISAVDSTGLPIGAAGVVTTRFGGNFIPRGHLLGDAGQKSLLSRLLSRPHRTLISAVENGNENGADLLTWNSRLRLLEFWDSKARTSPTMIRDSSTFTKTKTFGRVLYNAQVAIQNSSRLTGAERTEALRALLSRNYVRITAGSGPGAKNSRIIY